MVNKISAVFEPWRRRRRLAQIRGEFASHGFTLDHIDDSSVEAAVTRGERTLKDVSLNAKSIYLAAMRLSVVGDQFAGKQVICPAAQTKHL